MTTPSNPDPPIPLLLRVTEAARLLGFSRATLYTMIACGDLTVVRYNTTTRIPAAEITRWIAAYTVPYREKPKGNPQAPQ
jgi:excisionase family DNA binding protein